MSVVGLAASVASGVSVLVLTLFALHRASLLFAALRERRRSAPPPTPPAQPLPLPSITVQLPLFNEPAVAARVIEAACALDWPRDRFEVQILDDSNDDTRASVDLAAARAQARGVDVRVLRRATRDGYKAGALAHGLRTARGTLVAVFDADFVPPRDFLRALAPEFEDPRVGMAQARWGHLNEHASLLTRTQALLLDAHFSVEQAGRAALGRWFNFNGTAGLWRRACIDDAGGWHADTLSEDVDLSYRAQLRGWRFVYRDDVVTPAEIPETMRAFLIQQRRWMTGLLQVALKLLGPLWRSEAPLSLRLEACLHMLAPLATLASATFALTLPLSALWGPPTARVSSLLACGLVAAVAFYGATPRRERERAWMRAVTIPAVFALGLGTAPVIAVACVRGVLSRAPLAFQRTPKSGALGERAGASGRAESSGGLGGAVWVGLALAGAGGLAGHVALGALVSGQRLYGAPFVALVSWGLLWVGGALAARGGGRRVAGARAARSPCAQRLRSGLAPRTAPNGIE